MAKCQVIWIEKVVKTQCRMMGLEFDKKQMKGLSGGSGCPMSSGHNPIMSPSCSVALIESG